MRHLKFRFAYCPWKWQVLAPDLHYREPATRLRINCALLKDDPSIGKVDERQTNATASGLVSLPQAALQFGTNTTERKRQQINANGMSFENEVSYTSSSLLELQWKRTVPWRQPVADPERAVESVLEESFAN